MKKKDKNQCVSSWKEVWRVKGGAENVGGVIKVVDLVVGDYVEWRVAC